MISAASNLTENMARLQMWISTILQNEAIDAKYKFEEYTPNKKTPGMEIIKSRVLIVDHSAERALFHLPSHSVLIEAIYGRIEHDKPLHIVVVRWNKIERTMTLHCMMRREISDALPKADTVRSSPSPHWYSAQSHLFCSVCRRST